MDSPERNRIAAASSSISSPTDQESPLFNFLSNLSPIPVEAVRNTQRLLDPNFPPPQPVFASPRIDLQREPNFLKRGGTNDAGSVAYGQFETVLNTGLIPCSEKEVQSSSPSGCADDYLADPMEGEDSMNSAELYSRKANDAPRALQSGFTGQKKMVTKFIGGAKEKNAEIGSSISLTSSHQTDEDRPGNALELVQLAGNQRDVERFDEFPHVMSKKVADLAPKAQHSAKIVEQEATQNQRGTRRNLQFGCAANSSLAAGLNRFVSLASHMEPGRTSIIQPDNLAKDPNSIAGEISTYAVYGHRKSQDVEAATSAAFRSSNSISPPNASQNLRLFEQDSSPFTRGVSGLENTNRYKELNQVSPPKKRRREPNTSDSEVCKHCNCKRSKCLKLYCECFASGIYCANSCACEYCFNKPEYEDTVLDMQEQIESRNPLAFAPKVVKLGTDSPASIVDSSPFTRGVSGLENTNRYKELNQVSPPKTRRREPNTSDSEVCKHCNCKRSKCLKLYCECFASGMYCANSCACEYCFNKPEYEDTVLDTREQIESRNPLAFAPKVVKLGTDSPASIVNDRTRATPSSARHKRGCNCKKSMCLKKYCECFQATVGCSDGCRCEGCKNSFGPKAEMVYRTSGRREGPSQEKLETADIETASVDKLSGFPVRNRYLSSESVSLDQEWTSSKVEGADPFSRTLEGLADFNHFTPLSHPYLGTEAFLDASSSRDFPEVEESRSSSSPRSRSGLQFTLQDVPSFPHLTPYSNSKDGVNQYRSDPKDSSSDQ